MPGPLAGTRVVELAGIGPAPFCGMMLADHGAEVVRVDRIGATLPKKDPLSRSRRSIAVDLKMPEGAEVVRALAKRSDALIEGFRPGVMERLGLSPPVLLDDNPKLVYGRMTGWGQSGPLAERAGHDIDYIAMSGALHTCGRAGGQPSPPVNYLGDFGGGGMMLAFGILSALMHVRGGGAGQVVDCAMVDGSALLMGMTWHLYAEGQWRDEPGRNLLDSGAHFYDTYETSDGKWLAIGAIESQFYAELRDKLEIAGDASFDDQNNPDAWPSLRKRLAAIIRTRTRDEWTGIFDGSDACVAPVLSLAEAPGHAHNVARGTYLDIEGGVQPAPAPRYSTTACETPQAAPDVGRDTNAILESIGFDRRRVHELRRAGIIA